MKKYKIIEEHSGTKGDYIVREYTNSFARAVNILSRYHNQSENDSESDIKSSTLLAKSDNKYVEIGRLECVANCRS